MIFDLSILKLCLKFKPNVVYNSCKSSFKNRYEKLLHSYVNHFKKCVIEIFIKSLVLLCYMIVRFWGKSYKNLC